MRRTVLKALDDWVEKGLLTPEHAETLRKSLATSQTEGATRVFAVIGAILSGLGVILFVGSNWSVMGPLARVAALFGGYGLVVAGAVLAERKRLRWVSEATWLLVSLIFGANIFLLAQIFNFSLTYWQGPFWWMVGALMLGWARRSAWQASLAVPLGLLALGWLGGGRGRGLDQQLEFLVDGRGLLPLLPLVGIGLIALSLLAQRTADWLFTASPTLRWGLLLAAIPLIISTVDIEAAKGMFDLDGSLKQVLILIAVAMLVGLALRFGAFASRMGRPLFLGAAVFVLSPLLPVSGKPWMAANSIAFVVYILMVFFLALYVIWVGVRAQSPRLVNVGTVSVGLLIVIQYFSWTFALLDRSLAFLGGGLLLLVLSVVLERKRRALVAGISRPDVPGGEGLP